MKWLRHFEKLSHEELRTLGVLCGSTLLLLFFAVFISQGGLGRVHSALSLFNQTSQTEPVVTRSGNQVTVTFRAPRGNPAANAADVASFYSTNSWTAPQGVTSATVTLEAGGGGGANGFWSAAGCTGFAGFGGGGGSGGYYSNQVVSVSPGTAYPVTVGAGGIGSTFSCATNYIVQGGAGGYTSFDGLTATGGGGGSPGSTWNGGAGGSPNGVAGAASPGYSFCGYTAAGGAGWSGYGAGGMANGCNLSGANGQGGFVSITYTIPAPVQPVMGTAQCNSNGSISFSWSASPSGGAPLGYALRVDNTNVACGGTTGGNNNVGCVSPTDYVENELSNPSFFSQTVTPSPVGSPVNWWVNSYNNSGWSGNTTVSVPNCCPSGTSWNGSACAVPCPSNGGVGSWTANAYVITGGGDGTISSPYGRICVTNYTGSTYFIPARTLAEWNTFIAATARLSVGYFSY